MIGVADGVGGWADVGVNAGLYARELMSNSVTAILDEPKGCMDPARVLDKAHSITKAKGSSTACIIALIDQVIYFLTILTCYFTSTIQDMSTYIFYVCAEYDCEYNHQHL